MPNDRPLAYQTPTHLPDRTRLLTTYVVDGLLSFAGNLLFIGIFFYTANVFKWELRRNFMLAAGQGVVYVIGALLAQRIARWMGNRRLLIVSNIALAAVCVVGTLAKSPAVMTAAIIVYVPLLALDWPVLESLASGATDPDEMSRRIGVYNLVWAGTGAVAVAVQGTIIKLDPRGVFFIPLVIHVVCVSIFVLVRGYGEPSQAAESAGDHAHLNPEPELVRQRTVALWLSRIALPSTYVVIYSLSALMPLLPLMRRLDTTLQTLVGSAWMVSRWVMFWVLGASTFWHARPRLLLIAAVAMGLSFVGVAINPFDPAEPRGLRAALAWIVASQLVLGVALGMIYTASLYFGMVLSEGSTEHAGYHEALIGVGQILGPALGVVTQILWPGSLLAGTAAVASVIVLSIAGAATAAIKARSPE
jgi:MFS family permease